jgi:hypothetical protein
MRHDTLETSSSSNVVLLPGCNIAGIFWGRKQEVQEIKLLFLSCTSFWGVVRSISKAGVPQYNLLLWAFNTYT